MIVWKSLLKSALIHWPVRVFVIVLTLILVPSVPSLFFLGFIGFATAGNAITPGDFSSYLETIWIVVEVIVIFIGFWLLYGWAFLSAVVPGFVFNILREVRFARLLCIAPMYVAIAVDVWVISDLKLFPYELVLSR
jgi:hypothetical protein